LSSAKLFSFDVAQALNAATPAKEFWKMAS